MMLCKMNYIWKKSSNMYMVVLYYSCTNVTKPGCKVYLVTTNLVSALIWSVVYVPVWD